jgi:hypothetical protein
VSNILHVRIPYISSLPLTMLVIYIPFLLFLIITKLVSSGLQEEQDESNSILLKGYRISYPHAEDYIIELLINPCGVNDTEVESDGTIPLGYDCCMNRFGRGEFGFLKYDLSSSSFNDNGNVNINGKEVDKSLNHVEIFEKRIPAEPDEVLHNMVIVDEHGVEIPFEYSRRADDLTTIDETCLGFRDPYTSCLQKRLRALKSPYVPSCWDHNQTVDSTVSCYTPEGIQKPNCMQISYTQNSFIHVCGGAYSNDPNCGTFVEIHRSNGSPYDSEATTLSESKITASETNGMTTITIDLTYKGDKNRILCAYNETRIRVGSMVRITQDSPQCCCPPWYNKLSKHGSFFCPRKKGVEDGPFVNFMDTLSDQLENDKDLLIYPYCHDIMNSNQDILMCSREMSSKQSNLDSATLDQLIGLDNSLFYTEKCQYASINEETGKLFSEDLNGEYEDICPLGKTFQACGISSFDNNRCASGDSPFDFRNKIGKVMRLPQAKNTDKTRYYGVTFNDGRTVYDFPEDHLDLQEPHSNYELWFVQRNRFEKILQKRKGFRVVWPQCTFDPMNDRYFPFTEISPDGTAIKVLVEREL